MVSDYRVSLFYFVSGLLMIKIFSGQYTIHASRSVPSYLFILRSLFKLESFTIFLKYLFCLIGHIGIEIRGDKFLPQLAGNHIARAYKPVTLAVFFPIHTAKAGLHAHFSLIKRTS